MGFLAGLGINWNSVAFKQNLLLQGAFSLWQSLPIRLILGMEPGCFQDNLGQETQDFQILRHRLQIYNSKIRARERKAF